MPSTSNMNISASVLLFVFQCVVFASFLRMVVTSPVETSLALDKRSAAPDRLSEDYPDYQLGVRYDEYPTIVPKKRTALLVNRIMVALKDALEQDERHKNGVFGESGKNKLYGSDDIRTMDLQRRGHQSIANGQNKGRIYWRCYFNAVTCF